MAKVCGPPILRVGHQLAQVVLQSRIVELLEGFAIAEARIERVGFGGMLVQQVDAELLGPPVAIAANLGTAVIHRALACRSLALRGIHRISHMWGSFAADARYIQVTTIRPIDNSFSTDRKKLS